MILNLSDPLTATIAGGIVLMILGGAYHYVLTLVKLKVTDKKFTDVLSEMNTLHQNYKKEIADINQRYNNQLSESLKLTKEAIALYEKKMDSLLEHNKPHIGLLPKHISVNTSEPWKQ